MRSQESPASARLEPVPERIESSQAKLVYLCLEASEGATAAELAEALRMKKIDVLSVLHALEENGVVERCDDTYVVT